MADSRIFKALGLLLYGLVGFQSFHMIEHAMLYVQFYVQGLAKPTALIESIFNDTIVQVHFVFNLVLYAGLLAALALYVRARKVTAIRAWRLSNVFFFEFAVYGLVLFQSFHMFDHSLQYFQYYFLSIPNPRGLFGQFINESNIAIHIVVNGIIYLGLALATLSYRTIRKVNRLSSPILADEAHYPFPR